jgi:hypothetical protein
MKKLLLSTLIAVSVITSAFAGPFKGVSYFVSNSFKARYPGVSDVQWTTTPSYTKATFVLNNIRTEAFYKQDGDFIGASHAVSIDDLPIAAKRSFAKKYGSYTVKQAIKFDGAEEIAYFISAESERGSVVLKVVDTNISVFRVNGD